VQPKCGPVRAVRAAGSRPAENPAPRAYQRSAHELPFRVWPRTAHIHISMPAGRASFAPVRRPVRPSTRDRRLQGGNNASRRSRVGGARADAAGIVKNCGVEALSWCPWWWSARGRPAGRFAWHVHDPVLVHPCEVDLLTTLGQIGAQQGTTRVGRPAPMAGHGGRAQLAQAACGRPLSRGPCLPLVPVRFQLSAYTYSFKKS